MNARSITLLAGLLLLGGCAAKAPSTPVMTESDPAVVSLNEAAMRVARAAEQAALAQSVGYKRNGVTEEYQIDLSKVPPEMREPLLLENGFNGELETFLKSLAGAVGWQPPVILGTRPTTPLQISMTEQRRPPVLWVADAGYQAGAMADVSINSSLRQIIVRYKQPQGAH
ncbi:DotD/TraH family lipoprotein [Pseudomonas aeruginosa]|nr:DotD/TraH family lipoprotein [Pseudomonas aeruginosa]EIU2716835.1 DotD/TraH family lipoprotein [Pseudomonas aeruginosa]EIU2862400.1 DotD/TraH family lipoprotein [Pseudomonas aeruginosa]ELD5772911.1 DotD/TraH family lipoprotein [Pseudomonas aeruginosa]MBA5210246.1 DotD/TraH family lipoprotein [Pseudomonas aeruginosa]MBG3916886.1 DotD/TraH family lipoprotein [Pseudomonas aeruginosa]